MSSLEEPWFLHCWFPEVLELTGLEFTEVVDRGGGEMSIDVDVDLYVQCSRCVRGMWRVAIIWGKH